MPSPGMDLPLLADRRYEFVAELKNELHEVQVNLTEVIEDPNQSLKEPKA